MPALPRAVWRLVGCAAVAAAWPHKVACSDAIAVGARWMGAAAVASAERGRGPARQVGRAARACGGH